MTTHRVLTGITPSGTPHLGNYAGAIRPAIEASRRTDVESFYFLSDLHALIKTADPARVQRSTLEIAAAWLAAGLDTDRVWFYRQSDIPEIPELTWLLSCVTGKGLLNRAHAYKAAVDKNTAAQEEPDHGVTMGLFMYPVLMAADILMFKARSVPVGRDQIQHIEMARDIAGSFNHLYGEQFVLPEAAVDEAVATLPGLDGRKMSKSYDNTIPLFIPAPELKKKIFSIVTDSSLPGESKSTDCALFEIYQAFASPEQTAGMRRAFADGISWGDAKQALFELLDGTLAPMREKYLELIARPEVIEQRLQEGAVKARSIATPFLADIRQAAGIRNLASRIDSNEKETASGERPLFKQYREQDGRFYFKLLCGNALLLQSIGFDSPKEAGQCIARLKQGATVTAQAGEITLDGRTIAFLCDDADLATVEAALSALADA